MDKLDIKIRLDPVNDGIQTELCRIGKLSDTMALVIGVNGMSKLISGYELENLMCELGDDCISLQMGEYMVYLNGQKIVNLEGEDFFIGSAVITYWENHMELGQMKGERMQCAIEQFKNKLVELQIGDKSVDAFWV